MNPFPQFQCPECEELHLMRHFAARCCVEENEPYTVWFCETCKSEFKEREQAADCCSVDPNQLTLAL